MRSKFIGLFTFIYIVAIGQVDTAFNNRYSSRMKPLTGEKFRVKNLIDTNGRKVNISDFCSKVLLICFWSPDCGPSRVESRFEVLLMKRLRLLNIQDKVEFIKICGDVNFSTWKNYIKSNPQEGVQLYYNKNIFDFLKRKRILNPGLPHYWITNNKCKILGTDVATPEEIFLIDYLLIKAIDDVPCSISCQPLFIDWPKETSSSPEMRKLYFDLQSNLDEWNKLRDEILENFKKLK